LHGGSREGLEVARNLWAGVGLVRGGAGTVLVGDPETVAARIREYQALGIDTVIASGYRHLEESCRVAELLFPLLDLQRGGRVLGAPSLMTGSGSFATTTANGVVPRGAPAPVPWAWEATRGDPIGSPWHNRTVELDEAMETKPGAGAIVIAPAWDSCGSYEVFKGQIRTLSILGLKTYLLAVPGGRMERKAYGAFCRDYRQRTADLACTARGEVRLPLFKARLRRFEAAAAARSTAYRMTEMAQVMKLPRSLIQFLRGKREIFILCNHYFNVPIVETLQWTLRRKLKFALETHDIQSRHYRQREDAVSEAAYDTMLADEMSFVAKADRLIHINREEHGVFAGALPDHVHQVVYPTIPERPPVTAAHCKTTFLVVAAPNLPNAQSVHWFLTEVWERYRGGGSLRIVGGIDHLIADNYPEVFERWQSVFAGRIEDLDAEYAAAAVVVVPTISGEGISIKFAEAMAHGKPTLFTPHAVRGLPGSCVGHVRAGLCEDADALLAKLAAVPADAEVKVLPESLRVYRELFLQESHVVAYYEIVRSVTNVLGAQ